MLTDSLIGSLIGKSTWRLSQSYIEKYGEYFVETPVQNLDQSWFEIGDAFMIMEQVCEDNKPIAVAKNGPTECDQA